MNILYILDFFPEETNASDQIAGGVESRYFHLVKELRAKGHTVVVLARAHSLKEVAASSKVSIGNIFDRLILFQVRAIRAGLSTDFDIVEGGGWITYFTAYILGILKRKPSVFCYHDVAIGKWVQLYGKMGFIGEKGERFVLSLKPHAFIAVSESTKKALTNNGVDKSLVKVVQNGVNYKEVIKTRSSKKIYDICCVARLVGYKRLDVLIKAVAHLNKNLPKVNVIIIGQGPEEKNLKKLAKELGVERNIKFAGHLPSHRAVLMAIKTSRVFCLPSSFEGFGISVIEAQALGVPVVVSDIPALREVTRNGIAGSLSALGRADDLARKLNQMLTSKSAYKKFAKEGERNAQSYSWEKLADKLSVIYQNFARVK